MNYCDIETPESQAVAEAEEDSALVARALKREFPGEWLTKAFRIGCVSKARQERVRNLLAQHVEQVDMATAEGGLSHGGFTASQA